MTKSISNEDINTLPINHLVLCGGGPVGLICYGILKELSIQNIIKIENIKSIYTTSIGGFVALIYILNLEWSWMDDYLIKRPWENLLNFSSYDYLNLMYSKGLLNEEFFMNIIKPLLLAKDINIEITLKEFYDLTNVDLHIFTSNINKFCKVDINHKTHPDIQLYKALMMSCSIPVLIQPPYYNNEYYLDGGIFINTPLNDCYQTEKCDFTQILALTNDKRFPIDLDNEYYKNLEYDNSNNSNINENTNIFSFLIFILKTVFKKITIIENENLINIKNLINVCISEHNVDFNYWTYVFTNQNERERLIELGKFQAQKFIDNNIAIDCSNNTVILDCSNTVIVDCSNTVIVDCGNDNN